MDFPYWVCDKCNQPVAECKFPLTPQSEVPACPICGSHDHLDIALGDEDAELDTETIIYTDEVI